MLGIILEYYRVLTLCNNSMMMINVIMPIKMKFLIQNINA